MSHMCVRSCGCFPFHSTEESEQSIIGLEQETIKVKSATHHVMEREEMKVGEVQQKETQINLIKQETSGCTASLEGSCKWNDSKVGGVRCMQP